MTPERLSQLLQNIDDSLIARAGKRRRKMRVHLIRAVALCACLAVIITGTVHLSLLNRAPASIPDGDSAGTVSPDDTPDADGLAPPTNTDDSALDGSESMNDMMTSDESDNGMLVGEEKSLVTPLGIAVYPTSAAQTSTSLSSAANAAFVKKTAASILKNSGDNVTFSPANLYITLSMLAELSGGSSREQLLDLLGQGSVESARQSANTLWNRLYCNSEHQQSLLASSLWLNSAFSYNADTVNILKDSYYASTYAGVFGDNSMNEAYVRWINEQTDNMLQDSVKDKKLESDGAAVLATTLYFNALWENKFREEYTKPAVFHGVNGDTTTDFMNRSVLGEEYYYSDSFSAVSNELDSGGSVIFILPDEGKTVESLLGDDAALAAMAGDLSDVSHKRTKINMSIPKLDISAQSELKYELDALGVVDIFDKARADLSPLTTDVPLYVEKLEHTTRITVNEQGVRGAALTEVRVNASAAPPDDEVDFVLDRPFIMVITGADHLPRFITAVRSI